MTNSDSRVHGEGTPGVENLPAKQPIGMEIEHGALCLLEASEQLQVNDVPHLLDQTVESWRLTRFHRSLPCRNLWKLGRSLNA